jgi:FtsP/CotA-like multicopper oxidase with cupredoxin domain
MCLSSRARIGIGKVYRRAVYREYTDETFSKLKPRTPEWEHAGILGPILRAEVGDTIRVVFNNNATHPASMHSHGVFYNKASEGASYDDGTTGDDKADDDVPPAKTHVYSWEVRERAGPSGLPMHTRHPSYLPMGTPDE